MHHARNMVDYNTWSIPQEQHWFCLFCHAIGKYSTRTRKMFTPLYHQTKLHNIFQAHANDYIFTCFLYLSNLRSNFPFKVQVSSNVAISNIWSACCFLNKWEEWLLWDWLDERKVEGGEKLVTPYVSVVSPVHWMIFHIPASNQLDRLICI